MYRMLYMKMVERLYFIWLHDEYPQRIGNMSYKQYKEYIKKNDHRFYVWFRENFLSADQRSFKQTKVTPLVIQEQIVNGDIQWDGSDPDDAIVFRVGLENMQDEYCRTVLKVNDEAAQFLDRLNDRSTYTKKITNMYKHVGFFK